MANRTNFSRTFLCSTAAMVGAGLLSFQAQAAFNPDADSEVAATRLPDARIAATPAPPVGVRSNYIAPVTTIQMPPRPLYPTQAAGAPIVYAPPAAASPIIAPKPAMRSAPDITQAAAPMPPVPPAPVSMPAPAMAAAGMGFIAPAPVFAVSPPAAVALRAPEPLAAPDVLRQAPLAPRVAAVAAPVVVAATPQKIIIQPKGNEVASAPVIAGELLSKESKAILSHIPSKLDTVAQKASRVKMERVSPDVQSILGKDAKVESYDSVGLSIKVRRPGLDANYELGKAYTALMGGDTQGAVDIYRTILSSEPANQDALFGLAATYHRMGKLELARPLYGALLKLNPNHREGLNNFLALVSEESPQEALAELARLEDRNPQFSPIPAQTAILLDKLGFVAEAREKMLRAIDLAPDNLTYKYNLAIMLDRQGSYADAGALYRLLIDSALKGATIPSSVDALQRRLTFITTAAKESPARGT